MPPSAGIKGVTPPPPFVGTLEFRKQLSGRDLPVSARLQTWASTALLKFFILAPNCYSKFGHLNSKW